MGYPNDTVVIESVEWPTYYLRHTGYIYYLQRYAGSAGVANDAVFYLHNDTTNTQYIYAKSAIGVFADYYFRPLTDNSVRLVTVDAAEVEQTHFYTVGKYTPIQNLQIQSRQGPTHVHNLDVPDPEIKKSCRIT